MSPIYIGKLTDFYNRFKLIVQGVEDFTDNKKTQISKIVCLSLINNLIQVYQNKRTAIVSIMTIRNFQLTKRKGGFSEN